MTGEGLNFQTQFQNTDLIAHELLDPRDCLERQIKRVHRRVRRLNGSPRWSQERSLELVRLKVL